MRDDIVSRSARPGATLDGVAVGGSLQDLVPTLVRLQHVVLPLLGRMSLAADIEHFRPGSLPAGEGILRMAGPSLGRLRATRCR